MAKISTGLKKTIEEIKLLADGSIDDQIGVCKRIHDKIFPQGKLKTGLDKSVIQELLPTILKFMESDNHVLQKEGSDFVVSISNGSFDNANAKFVIDAGLITKLKKLLSSPNSDALINGLKTLVNIAYHFPDNVVENGILQSIIQCLKSANKLITFYSAWIMQNISNESDERVAAIFDANGVKPLIKLLESKNDDVIEYVLWSLMNISSYNYQYCQRVLDQGASKSFKKLCDRLFAVVKKPRRSNVTVDKNKLKQEKTVKSWAIEFIGIITSYGEVDIIINDKFVPLILQQINGGMTPEIKNGSIKVIENIMSVKRDFIPALVQDYNIFSFCYSNLRSTNSDLVIATLTAMTNIIKIFEDRDIIRLKIQECGGSTMLSNLQGHYDEEVRHLSRLIFEFVFDLKPDPSAGVPADDDNQREPELIELDVDDEENTVDVEAPQIGQNRKRPADTQPVERLRRSKRFKASLEQTNTENADSSSDDNDGDEDGNDQYNDFDEHPSSFSPPVNSNAGAAPTETYRHDHSGCQSFVGDDTVARDDGPSRFYPKIEALPTPQIFDMRTATPTSRQSPVLPVASASTSNETVQDEMKPLAVGPYGNPSRLSFHNFNAALEAASTNDGNIRNNHVGSQIVVNSETAATADEIIQSGIHPGKRSPIDDHLDSRLSSPPSDIFPALPVASSSTNNGTFPDNIHSRKPSPVLQPVITLTRTNQVTPPASAAANNGILRDETITYFRPAEFLIHQFCKKLRVDVSRNHYIEFMSKIEFTRISSNSKPNAVFKTIDQTGFGCLSLLMTGNEDASIAIRKKINQKFVDDLMQSRNFDEINITKVIGEPFLMKEEHLQTITTWLKCRILVYCNGWKKYGSWDEEDQMIPIFVLNKKEVQGKPEYSIVLTLKNH